MRQRRGARSKVAADIAGAFGPGATVVPPMRDDLWVSSTPLRNGEWIRATGKGEDSSWGAKSARGRPYGRGGRDSPAGQAWNHGSLSPSRCVVVTKKPRAYRPFR